MALENLSLSPSVCTGACLRVGSFAAGGWIQERHSSAWTGCSTSTAPAHLRLPAIAQILADRIRQGADCDYELHAWVVMPNHAHLLITPRVDVPILLRRLKGASAREANKLLGQTGQPFWEDESYDHLVRDADEFHRIENYILNNPVRAGLARSAEASSWCGVSTRGGLKPAAG